MYPLGHCWLPFDLPASLHTAILGGSLPEPDHRTEKGTQYVTDGCEHYIPMYPVLCIAETYKSGFRIEQRSSITHLPTKTKNQNLIQAFKLRRDSMQARVLLMIVSLAMVAMASPLPAVEANANKLSELPSVHLASVRQ